MRALTEEKSLYSSICATPEDQVLRRVFTDWLEERDDPRGEFIRVQCELSGKPDCPDWCDNDPEKCRVAWLERRERDLLKQYGHDWAEPVFQALGADQWEPVAHGCPQRWSAGKDGPSIEFRHGFVARVSTTTDLWLANGKKVAQVAPLPLEGVQLTDRNPEYGALERSRRCWWWVLARGQWERETAARLAERRHWLPYEFGRLCRLHHSSEVMRARRYAGKDHDEGDHLNDEEALLDLSQACVRWARGEVG